MDKELTILINLILQKPIVTINELESEFSLTRRQIMYRIDKINAFICDQGYPALSIGQQKHIVMHPETKKFLSLFMKNNHLENPYYLNKKERMDYIYMMLFLNQDYLSLQHFVQSLQLSRSTVITNIKDLNCILAESHIKIHNNREQGYHLMGSELDIRSHMMKLVILSLSDEKQTVVFDLLIETLQLDTFHYSKLIISELSIKHGIVFVGDRLDEFIYIFIYLKARISNSLPFDFEGHFAPYFEMIRSMKEFAFTQELMGYYKNTSEINIEELTYISAWILAVSIGNIHEPTPDRTIISDIVRSIMNRFEVLSATHYLDSTEIFHQLYAHFRPAYYRLLFKLPIFNPLCHRIQEQYRDFYALVEETMKPFHALFGGAVPEDELAYLTVHFASIFSKQRASDEIPKKRALVVCSNGIGSSAILYNQLKEMFPELYFYDPIEATKYSSFKGLVDVVFTTMSQTDLMDGEAPIIKVNTIMDLREKYDVIGQVDALLGNSMFQQPSIDTIVSIIKKHGKIEDEASLMNELLLYFSKEKGQYSSQDEGYTLSEILTKELIALQVEVEDWEEAVRLAGAMFVENHKATQTYLESVIQTNQEGPQAMVIAPHVALPHTRPEHGAMACAIGLVTLKHPLFFGESELNPVSYVFFLSALDNHQHLPAMSHLLDLLNDDSFYQILDQTSDQQEIIDYIRSKESQ